MSEDDVIEGSAREVTEAIARAKKIKEKLLETKKTGWYSYDKVEPVSLEVKPEFLRAGAENLKKTYGSELAAYICGLDVVTPLNRWISSKEKPSIWQARRLRSVIEITDILLSKLSKKEAKEWMMSPCNYLYSSSLPMDEIRVEPETVKRAALRLLV